MTDKAADKAMEAALEAFYTPDSNDSGLEPHARELRDMQRAIAAYHATLSPGVGEIAEIRATEEAPDTWKWKRLRNVGLSIEFCPVGWGFGGWRMDDFYGGSRGFMLGPIGLTLHYNSMDGIVAWFIGPHCEMDVQP